MSWVIENNHGCTDLPPTFEPTSIPAVRQIPEIKAWCEENFGPSRFGKDNRWYFFGNTFSVRREDDAFLFRLRWC